MLYFRPGKGRFYPKDERANEFMVQVENEIEKGRYESGKNSGRK